MVLVENELLIDGVESYPKLYLRYNVFVVFGDDQSYTKFLKTQQPNIRFTLEWVKSIYLF